MVSKEIQEPFRACLAAAVPAWRELLGDRLVSVVLYGSVARRTARPDSDLDVLVVAEGFAAVRPSAEDRWSRRGKPLVPPRAFHRCSGVSSPRRPTKHGR
jgi:predicted nucleotidyltransferase